MAAGSAPLASFEAKWTAAHPEFGVALNFVDAGERDARSAFSCLAFELEHAAFGIREAEPAAVKLTWWAEELARLGSNEARHPLTEVLAARVDAARIPSTQWQAVIVGALVQRDAEPAADASALLAGYARLYRPLAEVESLLFRDESAAAAAADAFALARSVRETAALADVLRDGRLPLPLDLLARHRLARGDLARETGERTAALRDWFSELRARADAIAGPAPRLAPTAAATLAASRVRLRRAARAKEPLAALAQAAQALPFSATWAAWRAARRSRS